MKIKKELIILPVKKKMKELEFRVVGLPAPQGSKTLTRYGGLMESSKNNAPYFCTSKTTGDVDKLTRSTLDALSVTSGGTVLADDSLVVCLQALKRYAKRFEHIGANINIKTFDKPE